MKSLADKKKAQMIGENVYNFIIDICTYSQWPNAIISTHRYIICVFEVLPSTNQTNRPTSLILCHDNVETIKICHYVWSNLNQPTISRYFLVFFFGQSSFFFIFFNVVRSLCMTWKISLLRMFFIRLFVQKEQPHIK